ncbi:MAG: trypsin-like serine protease, partial [Planctomycetia bacterium]|nr:trypsin-like serine protease [Planctomycetia bacterium]
MSLMNLSSLRVLFPGSTKKSVSKKSVSEKMNRKLALDSLEARVLLSVTPNTSYDVLVNTEYSADQSTNSNGNSVAVDSDGDFVVTWTRGDNIYKDSRGMVGWTDADGDHFYTDRHFIDGTYEFKNEDGTISVRDTGILRAYIDPDTGAPMVDSNIYARYFTDEVQRLVFDMKDIADGDMLYDFTLQTGNTYIQTLKFSPQDTNFNNEVTSVAGDYRISYKGKEDVVFTLTDTDPLQNARNIQLELEKMFGEGKVKVTPTTALEYTIEFEMDVQNIEDYQDVLFTCQAVTVDMWIDPLGRPSEIINVDEDAEAGCHVEMVRQPQQVHVYVVYEKEYNSQNEWTGRYTDKIDVAATAELITVAFKELQSTLVQGDSMNYGPLYDAEIVRKWNYEISVVPVYGLGDTLIGFDVTYVNSSGKQDMPELIVTELNTVNEAYFDDSYVDFVDARPYLKGDLLAVDAKNAEVHTLKQNSKEFRVNPTSDEVFNKKSKILRATDQTDASVALDADGDFVFTWTSEALQTKVQGSFTDIYARTFSASMHKAYNVDTGTYELLDDGRGYKATSNSILVNTTTADPQHSPCIAMDNDGNFTVVWAETAQTLSYRNGIYMQRFDAKGNKIGDELRVDTEYTGVAQLPQVAMSPDGKQIAVSWNWLEPTGGIDGIHVALYGYSTDANNVTTFEKLAEPQIGNGLSNNANYSTSIAFNKVGQFMVAWVAMGTDQYGLETQDTYVSQFKWNYTGTELKGGSLTTMRDTYRVNSASFDANSTTYWSGDHVNPSVGLDGDGDFVVSYDGNGIDKTENVIPTGIVNELSKFINDDVNADLLPYFDPLMDAFIPIGSHPTYGHYLYWMHNGELYLTNGSSDSLIETILAVAKHGQRDEVTGELELDEDGEPINPGCTMEQYSRLSAILHAVFDLTKGEGEGVNFSMFDSNPNQTLYPGQETILSSDNIANATRDGEDAKYYLTFDRTMYFDNINQRYAALGYGGDVYYADHFVRDENGVYERDEQGELIEKPVNQDNFTIDHMVWQTFNLNVGWKGLNFQVPVDLSGCYSHVDGIYRLNHTAATAQIENAIVAVLVDAWPREDGYEGSVEVRALSTTDADPELMRYLDGTPFDLNAQDETFSATQTCFEIEFSGILHDATVAFGAGEGTYYTTPCFQFDLNEATGKYYRVQVSEAQDGGNVETEIAKENIGVLNIQNDADGKVTNIMDVYHDFMNTLNASLTELGYNPNNYSIELVELVRVVNGEPENYWVVELTFHGYAGRDISVTLNSTKPEQQQNNGGDGQGGEQQQQQDRWPDWTADTGLTYNRIIIYDAQGATFEGEGKYHRNGAIRSVIRSLGNEGVKQWASSMDMTPDGDFTFAWTQDNQTAGGMTISQSIFHRVFNEEYDTFGPEVVEMYYSDGQKMEGNGQIELAPGAEATNDQKAFIVTFTEDMMDWKKITTETEVSRMDIFREHSVTNPENWQILKDGKIVENAIIDIYFGMNASADPYIQNMGVTAIAENKWEAVLVLNPDIEWGTGAYELVLSPKVQDANGNALNSDGTNKNGNGWESDFEIVAGSTDTEVITPGLIDPETGLPVSPDDPNGVVDTDSEGNVVERDGNQQIIDVTATDIWSPTATATDPEGDSVTVWTSTEKGYEGIFAKIDYVKWDDMDGRVVDEEGQLVLKVTDNQTAQFASVDMGGDGDFVVTWTQNDGENGKSDWNIWARMYDLNGNAKGDAFLVNNTTDGDQRYSQVAVSATGDFVITWQGHNASTGWDIYAQRYDANGRELGAVDEVQVLSFTRDFKGSFQLDIHDAAGNSYKTDFIEYGVNAYATKKAVQEALDKLGIKNIEFTVTAQSMTQIYIAMHVTDGSGIDLPEMGYTLKNQVGSMEVQTYQEGRFGEFMVNETTENDQKHAAIDMDYEGNFVISWTSYGSKLTNQTEGGDEKYQSDIFARQFKSSAELGLLPDVNTFEFKDYITRVDGVDENPVTNSGIAYLTVSTAMGTYSGTGVLLADGNCMYVLTAAHVVTGDDFLANSANTGIYFYTTEGEKLTAQMDELFIYEGYNPQYGIGDLAIIKLTSSLKGMVTGYNINRDMTKDVGAVYTRYGFGTYGEGSTGATEFEDFLMHTGQNKWEYSEVGLLYYDFDDGTDLGNALQNEFNIPSDLGLGDAETCAAHGDSGGPCFVNNLVAGICHGGTSDTSVYGTVGVDTQVAYFANWIDNITGVFQETIIGATGAEFRVNDDITGTQLWSDVALDADGDFVITWTSASDDTSQTRDIYAKRYAADGTAVNDSFLVNTTTGDKQQISKVAMDADGDFVIVWESYQEYNDGGFSGSPNNYGIYAQRYVKNSLVGSSSIYGNDGEIGNEYRINTHVKYDQRVPNVAMTATGDMIFSWQSVDANGQSVANPSSGIYSRTYYKAQDDAGPVIVGVNGGKITFEEIVGVDQDGKNITETKTQDNLLIKDGDLIRGTLSEYLDITFDEQVVGQRGELTNNSMLIISNIQIKRDGLVITSDVIDHIECIGFAQTDEDYIGSDGNRIQKNIFRVIFKDGVSLADGKYEVTVSDRVQDIFENKLDGNMDGEPGGSFKLEFEITTNPEEDGTKEPLAPEFEPVPNPGDADTTKVNNVANTTTAGGQKDPAIAMNDNGDYVTVWVSEITETITVPSDDTNTDGT